MQIFRRSWAWFSRTMKQSGWAVRLIVGFFAGIGILLILLPTALIYELLTKLTTDRFGPAVRWTGAAAAFIVLAGTASALSSGRDTPVAADTAATPRPTPEERATPRAADRATPEPTRKPTPEPTRRPTPRPTPEPTPVPLGFDEQLAAAENISYDDLFRNSADHFGKDVAFRGQMLQVLGEPGGFEFRIAVTPGEYGFWDDPIYVFYEGTERFLVWMTSSTSSASRPT